MTHDRNRFKRALEELSRIEGMTFYKERDADYAFSSYFMKFRGTIREALDSAAFKRAYLISNFVENPEPTGVFMALFSDGSGGALYKRIEGGLYIDAEGDVVAAPYFLDAGYLDFIALPDDYELFCEGKRKVSPRQKSHEDR